MNMIIENIDCTDLEKVGTAKIYMKDWDLRIELEGFEFSQPVSCRESAIKSLLWLRAVIDAQIKTNKLVPGGNVSCCVN